MKSNLLPPHWLIWLNINSPSLETVEILLTVTVEIGTVMDNRMDR